MFENEGNEVESTQSDVTQEPSSEVQNDAQTGQQAAAQQVKDVPFHEHPRWKEVMEERNAEKQRSQALESQLQDLQRQLMESMKPKVEPTKDPMLERLTGIDPEFAKYIEGLSSRAAKAEALETRIAQFEQQQFNNSARAQFAQLNTKNNVAPELASLYEQQLEAAYSRGEFKDLNGLEKTYSKIHDNFNKLLQTRDRDVISKYTADKKSTANKPSGQPKGRSPNQTGKVEFSKNPQEAKQQLIQHIAANMKASREV